MWDVCPTPRQRGQATEIRNPWIVLWWWCQEAEEEEDGWKIGFRFLMAFANWKQRKILICFDGCLSSPCPNCCACVPPWGISWLTDGGIRLSRCGVETALLCTTCFTTSDLLLPLWRYEIPFGNGLPLGFCSTHKKGPLICISQNPFGNWFFFAYHTPRIYWLSTFVFYCYWIR